MRCWATCTPSLIWSLAWSPRSPALSPRSPILSPMLSPMSPALSARSPAWSPRSPAWSPTLSPMSPAWSLALPAMSPAWSFALPARSPTLSPTLSPMSPAMSPALSTSSVALFLKLSKMPMIFPLSDLVCEGSRPYPRGPRHSTRPVPGPNSLYTPQRKYYLALRNGFWRAGPRPANAPSRPPPPPAHRNGRREPARGLALTEGYALRGQRHPADQPDRVHEISPPGGGRENEHDRQPEGDAQRGPAGVGRRADDERHCEPEPGQGQQDHGGEVAGRPGRGQQVPGQRAGGRRLVPGETKREEHGVLQEGRRGGPGRGCHRDADARGEDDGNADESPHGLDAIPGRQQGGG